MSDISKIIKAIRKESGLTQSLFAKRVGLRQNQLSLIEGGKLSLSIELLAIVINEFNVDPNRFFDIYKNGLISDKINTQPIVEIISNSYKSEDNYINISGNDLDQIIKYKLHYMEFYLLGILEHVRTIQEDLKKIEYKEEKFILESAYIKRYTGDPFEDKVPPYINYTPKEKLELIKELDKATMEYLDNIWLITMSLV
jgi:transcriptional regulator with XRE-family HTH domain